MQKRDEEISAILNAIDGLPEDGEGQESIPEEGLLGELPIAGGEDAGKDLHQMQEDLAADDGQQHSRMRHLSERRGKEKTQSPRRKSRRYESQRQEEMELVDLPDQEEDEERTRRGRRVWRAVKRIYFGFESIIMVAVALVICGYLSWYLLNGMADFLGINQEDQQYEVVLEKDSTVKEVCQTLEDQNIISSPLIFQLYAKLKKVDILPAGTYVVNSNMSFDSVLKRLSTSTEEAPSEVEVTFREGLTVNEIANLLEENDVCDADKFIEALQTEDFGFAFEQLIQPGEHRFYKLEGYLFPDTYNFYVGENPKSAAKRFLTRFNELVFTDKMTAQMEALGMSLDETVILASIIQAEAGGGGYKEMCRVSSVFHNRLNNPDVLGGMLQSDVTIFYVNDNIKPYLNYTDQDMYDAYNTYKCVGLPVGAICNPGLEAIQAALNPEETNYFYFLTDDAGTFYYANTLQEHEYNNYLAQQVNAQLKEQASQEAAASEQAADASTESSESEEDTQAQASSEQ